MPKRVAWDRYEVALLFDAYEHVAGGSGINTEAAQLSQTLRNLAKCRGISIDDTYRNLNGMKMQLANVQFLFTNGEKGLSSAASLIRQMYELYKANPAEYQTILKEAIRMTGNAASSVEDAFFAYAKKKTGLSTAMLTDCLRKAADYCFLKQPLLGMTDVKAVRNVQKRVAEGKLLRIRFGKDTQTIRNVTQLYYTFIKNYCESKEEPDFLPTPSSTPGVAEQTSHNTANELTGESSSAILLEKVDTTDASPKTPENTEEATSQELTSNTPEIDQPKVSSKIKHARSANGEVTSLDAFKRFLHEEKGFAERTAGNYWTSIRMIEAYIQRNHLGFSLLNTDAAGAQKAFDFLMALPDFEQTNIKRHRQFSAALVQYVAFLRQGGVIVSGGADASECKRPGQNTIAETVFDVLRHAGKRLTVSEIYQAIVKDDLYQFDTQDPQSDVSSAVSVAHRQMKKRISEGKDVLIEAEEDGTKKYQVMTAGEAAENLKRQQKELALVTAASWAKYEALLKQTFQKGFQKESGLDMKKLRKRWAEIHGEELNDSDDIVRLQLAAHCVDTGKRWYLAELLLTEDDRKTVLEYIDRTLSSGKQVLYYSSIYAALEHELESTVLTEDLLASYLQATCQDRYILRAHYVTNDYRAKVDLAEEIKDVMLAYGRPIHTDELKRTLHHLPPDQVERELHIHPEFIMDAFYMYFHESMADLTDEELDRIAAFIQAELDEQGYMIGDWIQQKLERLYPETAERLSFLTQLGVRGAVAYKLRDRFTFSGPVITPKGKTMNMHDVFALFCQRHAPFSIDELASFAKECDSAIYLGTVHQHCTRINENDFVANGVVHWNVPHVDAAIALHCPGKYTSLKSIQYFDAFPFVGYPWNNYLLEQYVATESKDFMLMHSSYAKNTTSGAIVRRDAGFESFDEVLADELANAPVLLESRPCLEHLVNEGYITRKKLSNMTEIITRAKMLRSQKG